MKISIFGVCSTIQILLFTALKGTHIGTDNSGNKYYKCVPRKGAKLERRWVMYVDKADASLVPPEWHGWLQHQTDIIPGKTNKYRQSWQKPHKPNLSGIEQTYFPSKDTQQEKEIVSASGNYVSWQPPEIRTH